MSGLRDTDFLSVALADNGRKFHLRLRSLTSDPARRPYGSTARYNIRGTVMYDYYDGGNKAAVGWFRELPEGHWDKKDSSLYIAPATDSVAITILRTWRSHTLPVDQTAEDMLRYLKAAFEAGEQTAIEAAKFKSTIQGLVDAFKSGDQAAIAEARARVSSAVPPLPAGWQERSDRPLEPYQRAAVKFSLDNPGFALHMDRGTGKTATAVQRTNMLAIMLRRGEIKGGAPVKDGTRMLRTLVVVPNNVRLNWQREFQKFSHVAGKVRVLRGSQHQRVRSIAEAALGEVDCFFSVMIVSYDSLRTTINALAMVPWDDVICDEAHYFKDQNTQRYKDLQQLRDLASARRLELTGSPIGNSPMDLWAQLEFLREGGSGFTSKQAFKSFYGQYAPPNQAAGHGVVKLLGLQNIPLLQERLARMTFAVTKEEAGLNLPDKVRLVREVEMTPYQREVYYKLQDELALQVEDKLSGAVVDQVTIENVLVMLLRLHQVTSGHLTYDAVIDPDTMVVVKPKRIVELSPENPKVVQLLELLQDPERSSKAKTIVWCQFIHNINIVQAALTAAGIKSVVYYGGVKQSERDAVVDQFNNDPETTVFIGNTQTAGEGLNLLGYDVMNPDASDTYCDMEVFFSIDWSALRRQQAEDRAHRRGTRMPVQIIDLVVPGSIDEDILDRIIEKRETAEAVLDLRDTIRGILTRHAA